MRKNRFLSYIIIGNFGKMTFFVVIDRPVFIIKRCISFLYEILLD